MVWKALPRLKIAVACHADWNAMAGDDKVRFCGQCCQNVYDVRRLRPREVAALIESHGERMPCLRLYQRPDGTVLTRSCLAWAHVGVAVVRWSAWSVAALAVGFWSQVLLWHGRLHPRRREPTAIEMQEAVMQAPRPRPVPPLRDWLRQQHTATMGAIRPTPPPEPRKIQAGATEGQVHVVVQELARRLDLSVIPPVGRIDVTVNVKRNGRVARVKIEGPSGLTPAARQELESTVRGARFPRNADEYTTEFPLVLQH